MRRPFFSLLLATLLATLALLRTEGFSPLVIEGPLPLSSTSPISPSVREALSQPYRFFGRGRQSYAFVSEDGQKVIKFFDSRYFHLPWYAPFLPEKWREKEAHKRQRRALFYREGYPLAAALFSEACGILYLHFGPAGEALPSLTLIDRAERRFAIDLNRTPFVLQKRAEPLYPCLRKALSKEQLFPLLEHFLSHTALRIAAGIADADRDVEHNFGVLEGRVIHFDPGRWTFEEELLSDLKRREEEWRRATHRLRRWLMVHRPDALDFFDKTVRQKGT